jgi:hypothetical protein
MRVAVCTARGYAVFRGIDLSARDAQGNGLWKPQPDWQDGRVLHSGDTPWTACLAPALRTGHRPIAEQLPLLRRARRPSPKAAAPLSPLESLVRVRLVAE